MDLKSLGQTIVRYGAPLLGSIIPVPGAAAIGQLIAHEFGGDINKPDELATLISNDPQAQVKLAEIQNNTKVQLQQLFVQNAQNELAAETQQKEIDFQNTKNARDSNAQAKSWMPEIVSILSIVGFFACVWLVANHHQEEQDEQVLYMLLGSVAMAFSAVINYWLGSSHTKTTFKKP